jgi:hypothetical protein
MADAAQGVGTGKDESAMRIGKVPPSGSCAGLAARASRRARGDPLAQILCRHGAADVVSLRRIAPDSRQPLQ